MFTSLHSHMPQSREVLQYGIGESSLGSVLVATSTKGVCAIYLSAPLAQLTAQLQFDFPSAEFAPGDCEFDDVIALVLEKVESPTRDLALSLDIRGGDFERLVWAAVRTSAPGTMLGASEIARRIGASPESADLVERVCRDNRIAVVLPCHRVAGAGGERTGYRWGESVRRALLERERYASQ